MGKSQTINLKQKIFLLVMLECTTKTCIPVTIPLERVSLNDSAWDFWSPESTPAGKDTAFPSSLNAVREFKIDKNSARWAASTVGGNITPTAEPGIK